MCFSGAGMDVIDEQGRQYTLVNRIASGAQGNLHLDKTGRFLIKLLTRNSSRERLRRQIERVRRMPLDGLHITRPLNLLREPSLGYVMDYIAGASPIRSLIVPSDPKSTDWPGWYIETGGLKGRLEVLYKCAQELSNLHARGIVYGDLSSNNVLYSRSDTNTTVYLIDIDNLTYETDFADSVIYTPFYGAPEVVTGRQGVNTLTDSFSFGVLAFEVLCSHHPLIGEMVDNGTPELEEEALAGKLPWVLHSTDKRNSWPDRESIYPLLLSPKLQELFKATFEDGLLNPSKRPGMNRWTDVLYHAFCFVLECPKCGWTYYERSKECPRCRAQGAAYVLGEIFSCWLDKDRNTLSERSLGKVIFPRDAKTTITRRFLGDSGVGADIPVADISFVENHFIVIPQPDSECWVTSSDWKIAENVELGRKYHVTRRAYPYPYSWAVRIGPLNGPHYKLELKPQEPHQAASVRGVSRA